MANQAWQASDVQGLTPAIDPRKSDKLYVMSGRNFYFDSQGPKSGFGNRLLTSAQFSSDFVQGIRVPLAEVDRTFTFFPNSISEWVEATQSFVSLFVTADTTLQPHRWTHGYLNGELFFCHPAVGIVGLNLATNVVTAVTGPGVPLEPIAICVDNGRLLVMDRQFLYWSRQSNGRAFDPSLGGAGFQRISDRVSGEPVSLHSYSKGVLVFTTGGIMRSEFTGDSAVYRHRAINTEFRPVNSFCTVQMDDNTIVILDERGLLSSKGESPVPLTPLFNEFLIQFLQDNNINN